MTDYQFSMEALASKALKGAPAEDVLLSYHAVRKEFLARQIINGTTLTFDANKAAYDENEKLRVFAEEIKNARINPETQ